MLCPFCSEEVEGLQNEPAGHVLVGVTGTLKEHHTHVHGSLENKLLMIKMVDAIITECGLESFFKKTGV